VIIFRKVFFERHIKKERQNLFTNIKYYGLVMSLKIYVKIYNIDKNNFAKVRE